MPSWLQKTYFYSSAAVVYAATALLAWLIMQPAPAIKPVAQRSQVSATQLIPKEQQISGIPTRIVIPASGVDLPIDIGQYDTTTHEWSLSGYRAQYAAVSVPANNLTGDTLIYGHNNNYVFGALRHKTPDIGAQALLYTDNGHIFQYAFRSVASVTPNDTSIFQYDGPPMLTIQTCTGSLNEWRTLFRYSFEKVVQ